MYKYIVEVLLRISRTQSIGEQGFFWLKRGQKYLVEGSYVKKTFQGGAG